MKFPTKWLAGLFAAPALALRIGAQGTDGLEVRVMATAKNVDYAVMAITYWGPKGNGPEMGVVGSAFLISDEGYFITAAHVLARYDPNSAQLVAIRRSKTGNGAGTWFDVIEKDEQRDLALCKLKNFVAHFPKAMIEKLPKEARAEMAPFASLAISSEEPQVGRFILIAGFPLGSWNPAIQLGTIAATETINPNVQAAPGARRPLLQISVAGNQGNSGCPVVDLRTGRVVGVIVQEIVSPLFSSPEIAGQLPFAQSSGIMLAAPSKWIQELLDKHKIKSAFHGPDGP